MLRFNHDHWDIYLVDRIVNGVGVNDSPLEEQEAVEINKDDGGEDMVEEATEEQVDPLSVAYPPQWRCIAIWQGHTV